MLGLIKKGVIIEADKFHFYSEDKKVQVIKRE